MLKRYYQQLLDDEPEHLSHLEKVLRCDRRVCKYYVGEITQNNIHTERRDGKNEDPICTFYQFMDAFLLDYFYAYPELEDVLAKETAPSINRNNEDLPIAIQIAVAHFSPWAYPVDIHKQIVICKHYIEVLRPLIRYHFCQLSGLTSNEKPPF